jgi:SPP1 family predicted phage head-tail adaptor
MGMDIGSMDQRVTLQRRTGSKDAVGQQAFTWTDVCTVWAQVQAVRGREFFAAAQAQQEQTVKVRIRYRTDIDATLRLVHKGVEHHITGVIPVGRNEMLEIMCLEGVRDGR